MRQKAARDCKGEKENKLAVLTLHGRPHSRQDSAADVWPERTVLCETPGVAVHLSQPERQAQMLML